LWTFTQPIEATPALQTAIGSWQRLDVGAASRPITGKRGSYRYGADLEAPSNLTEQCPAANLRLEQPIKRINCHLRFGLGFFICRARDFDQVPPSVLRISVIAKSMN